MEENKIISGAVDALVEKKIFSIVIDVKNPVEPSFFDRVLKRKAVIEHEREFTIRPLTVGNMKRIAGRAALLPADLLEGTITGAIMPLIESHMDDIVYILGVGIQNDRNEPSKDLIAFILDNFDAQDIYDTLLPVLENTGMQSFFNSIALAKGTVNILRPSASPIDGRE